jgi:serine-type D-Ala-D-Ala carboxypeptidase/endopeptidase (penicillin-binding protein 4)
MKLHLLFFTCIIFFVSCGSSKKIAKSAKQKVIDDSALYNAHVGISIYEPATGKYLFNYQGDKYFVPASNTKIPTCYAAMKYLGDSLVGLRYGIPEQLVWRDNTIIIDFTGDPTFLHKDYRRQTVFDLLKSQLATRNKKLGILFKRNDFNRWGSGWGWSDYKESYMAERSPFPVHGNVVHVSLNDSDKRIWIDTFPSPSRPTRRVGKVFKVYPSYFDSMIRQYAIHINAASSARPGIEIERKIDKNEFRASLLQSGSSNVDIPFVTDNFNTALNIISDTFKRKLPFTWVYPEKDSLYSWDGDEGDIMILRVNKWHTIHSQPTDSLLKPMMHRSDNFFAEQSLLMVSNEMLGVMNDAKIIDTLLKTDFKDLPQMPRWVDGCGLSRYNLFTPQDMVAILNKMQKEFGMDRIKEIFATGGEGTLSSYYRPIKGFIYAKTGTLSGVVALSGFLYTKKNKLLIFSVLVNNHNSSATQVRRAVERFVVEIREHY